MKYLVVTSWSPEGAELYGARWIETFEKYWPAESGAFVVTDEMIYADLEAAAFFERHKDKRQDSRAPGYNYRHDLYRFAHKIFALKLGMEKAREAGAEWVVWLDGDVVTTADISAETLADWLPDDKAFVYLSRRETWDHPECGFMGFRLDRNFLGAVVHAWTSNQVTTYAETHDSHVIGELAKQLPKHAIHDLCPRSDGLEAFGASPLGNFLTHLKGNRKFAPAREQKSNVPQFKNRYELLNALVEHFAPRRIVEVGTWNGERAKQLATAAHKAHGGDVFYIGYDLFEHYSKEIDAKELNVKRHFSVAEVTTVLTEFKNANPWFDFILRPGDTWETLSQTSPVHADLVYIDGGHSIDTIKHDFSCFIAPSIILDDYYFPENSHPDVEKFGVNKAVRAAQPFGPIDPVYGGGGVSLAYTGKVPLPAWAMRPSNKEEVKSITGGAFDGNVVLKTRNCRPEEELRENIRTNLQKISKWIGHPVASHATPLILVSAGESLKHPETLAQLREWKERGASIWCVKHSHNFLIDNGIIPFACVLLDPRPHEGPSTHGFDRAGMLANPHKDVKYFAASMVDPTVIVHLLEKDANVWGWHAAVGANEKELLPPGHHLVPGGSTSVMRAISLGWALGYRVMKTYAMDSCHLNPDKLDRTLTNPDGTPKYFEINVEAGGKKRSFWTDRDLLAQAQDYTRLIKEMPMLDIEAVGPGMVPYIHEISRGKAKTIQEIYGFGPA